MRLRCPDDVDLDGFLKDPKSADAPMMEFLEVLINENLKPWDKTAKSIKSIKVIENEWHDPQLQIEVTT